MVDFKREQVPPVPTGAFYECEGYEQVDGPAFAAFLVQHDYEEEWATREYACDHWAVIQFYNDKDKVLMAQAVYLQGKRKPIYHIKEDE